MNFNDKKFRPTSNNENGETSSEPLFHYKQVDNTLTSEYLAGKIIWTFNRLCRRKMET